MFGQARRPYTGPGRRVVARTAAVAALLLAASWQPARGDVSFAAASGNLAASADFAVVGGGLQVTLANTSTADVLVPTDVLTAVFFSITDDPLLTRTSAVLSSGSTVLFGTTDPGGVVGGEWAYQNGLAGPGGANSGISSSGLGLFGPGDVFPGTNLQGPDSPDGLQYGITSAGDDPATGNTPVTGSNALIKNAVTFELGSLPSGFDLSQISNVSFQYGTALTDTNIMPVPEPQTYATLLAGLGILGLVLYRRRKTSNAVSPV